MDDKAIHELKYYITDLISKQAGITRWILITGLLITFAILIVTLITVLSNRKDRKNWKIWKDSSQEYMEHMHIVAMAKAYPDGSINVNSEGHIRYTSDRITDFTGWKRSELKGQLLSLLFSTYNLHKLNEFKKQHSDTKDKCCIEVEIVLKNEKLVPVDVMVSDFEHEDQIFSTYTIRDISHRKANEWARKILQERAQKANDLLELEETLLNSGGWIWHMSEDNVECSPGMNKIFSLKGEKVSGKDLMDKVFIDDRENVNNVMSDGIKNCHDYEIDYRVMQGNGRKDLIKCIGHPVCNENGRTIKVNGAVKLIEADVD